MKNKRKIGVTRREVGLASFLLALTKHPDRNNLQGLLRLAVELKGTAHRDREGGQWRT